MLIITSLIFVLCINVALFVIAYCLRSDKLTDFAYALSFIAVAASTFIFNDEHSTLLRLLITLVVIWALRLGTFLVIRIRKAGKDTRFDGIREDFLKFLKFWVGQGLVAWVLLLPLLFVAGTAGQTSSLTYVGVAIWLLGLTIETTADLQKYRFAQNPANKDKWIDSGLWHYSLHPNYFGEMVIWVGFYLATFAALDTPQRLIGLISPLTIILILRFVTGVPPLEKLGQQRWGNNPKYQARLARTNLLLPFWPRRSR